MEARPVGHVTENKQSAVEQSVKMGVRAAGVFVPSRAERWREERTGGEKERKTKSLRGKREMTGSIFAAVNHVIMKTPHRPS